MVKQVVLSKKIACMCLALVAFGVVLNACGSTTTTTPSTSAPKAGVTTVSSGLTATAGPLTPTATVAHAPVSSATIILSETSGQYAFNPKTVTIKAGETVAWKNTTSSNQGVTGVGFPSSPPLPPGATYTYTFHKAGSYEFSNPFHPSVKGTVIVK
ncbi:MAG TPA: cupredoxin domain-containing protein [Ktedonobacterales bacterium]|jgi:plastocyanin